MFRRGVILAIVSICSAAASPADAETLSGPLPAFVERVIDGDTIGVRVRIWLGQELTVGIRLRGVDAPELRGVCESERLRAEAARDFVMEAVGSSSIALRNVAADKFFGRAVADVSTEDGRDLADAVIQAGHGRPYDGGRRGGWCDVAER